MEIELAIYEDCLNLIDKFCETANPNFKSFCEQWKNDSFQHIYAAQTTAIEVIQTTKTILHLAKRIICAKDELGKLDATQIIRRIGGIYLMYAIYFKQPTKQYVKILVSYETWQDLVNFIEDLPDNETASEARYIFCLLYKLDAFRFTALDYDVGLEKLVDYDQLYDIHKGNKSEEVVRVKLKQKLIAIAETEKILPNMIALEEKYNKTKESLSENRSTKSLPPTKIFRDIHEAMKSIHAVLEEKNIPIATTSKTGTSYDVKRKELKRKAAGRADTTLHDEESEAEDSFHQDGARKYFGKTSVRQLMSQELPEDINEDLKNSSAEEEEQTEITSLDNIDIPMSD